MTLYCRKKVHIRSLKTSKLLSKKENIEDLLIETLQRYILKTDIDYVEQKSLFNYPIIVFIVTVFFYGFLFILTFVQLIIPLFSYIFNSKG